MKRMALISEAELAKLSSKTAVEKASEVELFDSDRSALKQVGALDYMQFILNSSKIPTELKVKLLENELRGFITSKEQRKGGQAESTITSTPSLSLTTHNSPDKATSTTGSTDTIVDLVKRRKPRIKFQESHNTSRRTISKKKGGFEPTVEPLRIEDSSSGIESANDLDFPSVVHHLPKKPPVTVSPLIDTKWEIPRR